MPRRPERTSQRAEDRRSSATDVELYSTVQLGGGVERTIAVLRRPGDVPALSVTWSRNGRRSGVIRLRGDGVVVVLAAVEAARAGRDTDAVASREPNGWYVAVRSLRRGAVALSLVLEASPVRRASYLTGAELDALERACRALIPDAGRSVRCASSTP